MKTFFEIIPDSIYKEECSLTCEISGEGVSFCIRSIREQKFIGVAIYNFDKSRPRSGYHIALQILFGTKAFLSGNYQKVIVVYSTPESVLIPFPMFDRQTAGASLKLLHGDLHHDTVELTDLVTEKGYYNSFRVDEQVYKTIAHQFPERVSWHQRSLILGRHSSGDNKLYAIFYSYKMVVAVFIDGKCHLINSYPYQFAEDVSYHLLALREHYKTDDIPIEVSGFIEKESTLYAELYKYFQDISFSPLPAFCEYSDDILRYPSHYFSHLFELDPCG